MFIESVDNPDDSKLTYRIMSSGLGMMVLENEFVNDEGVVKSEFYLIHDAVVGAYLGDGLGVLRMAVTTLKMKQYQPISKCVEVTLEDGRSLSVLAEQQVARVLDVILTKRTVFLAAMMHDPRFKPEKKRYH